MSPAPAITREPCHQCPFRNESPLAYDTDAMAALDEGHEPSCHSVVGMDAVFHDFNPGDANRCIGFERWASDRAGFRKPILA